MVPSVKTIAKIAYCSAILSIAGLGTLNMLTKAIRDESLCCFETAVEQPQLSLSGWLTEQWQHQAAAWFEQHWGLRGIAVKTDNSVNVALFRESRPGQHVIVGKENALIVDDDGAYYNRTDGPEGAIASARRMAAAQRRLRNKGHLLLPVIAPSKTSFYEDALPSDWIRRGSAGASTTNLYRPFVNTLREEGAAFVDARALFKAEGWSRVDVFPRTGRHWTKPAACRTLQAIADAARNDIPQLGTAQLDCKAHTIVTPDPNEEEFDLLRLQNLWHSSAQDVAVYQFHGHHAGPEFKVPTLFVGSSFLWKLVRSSRDLDAYRPSLLYYYDKTAYETENDSIVGQVEPSTEKWRRDTFSKRLFVVDVLETYIPFAGQEFLGELEDELKDPQSPIYDGDNPVATESRL